MYRVIVLIVFLSVSVAAQNWWIGGDVYIPASRFGIDMGLISSDNIGWFGSFNSNFIDVPQDNYYTNIDYDEAKYYFKDRETKTIVYKTCFYGGITYPLTENILLCPAIAFYQEEIFKGFFDKTHILGTGGTYYVKSTKESGAGFNCSVLYWRKENNMTFRLGGEMVNGVFNTSLGLGYVLSI